MITSAHSAEISPLQASDKKELSALQALGLYTLLAIVMTWPLVSQFTTHIPRGAHDIYQNIWNLWWWKTALTENFASPYTTNMLFSPGEVPLGNHTHSPGNMILSLPINLLLGEAAALNLSVLASFIFSAHGVFLLARLYTRSAGASFLGGIAFAYLPQHVEQTLEHINLASYQAMPYFSWALASLCRYGGKWWLATGGFFALNALYSWHNGLMVVPLGIGVFLFESIRSERPFTKCFIEASLAALLAVLVISPFLWPLIRDTKNEVAILQKGFPPKPVHPLFTMIPHSGHPLWGESLFATYKQGRTYPSVGFMAYLGVIPLALASTAILGGLASLFSRLFKRSSKTKAGFSDLRAQVLLWSLLGFFFLSLAFGESWKWTNEEGPQEFFLPFHWMKKIPFFGLVRVPNRFLVPAALCFAVLASFGARSLGRPLIPKTKTIVFSLMTLLVILDLAWWPYPMRELTPPDYIQSIRDLPEDSTLLNIPSGHRARAADDMLLQTWHGKPIASGYLSTRLHSIEDRLKEYPVLRKIFERYPPEEANSGPNLVSTVRNLKVDYVILHFDRTVESLNTQREKVQQSHPDDFYQLRLYNPEKGMPRATLNRFQQELREAFGEPIYQIKELIEIYKVTASP